MPCALSKDLEVIFRGLRSVYSAIQSVSSEFGGFNDDDDDDDGEVLAALPTRANLPPAGSVPELDTVLIPCRSQDYNDADAIPEAPESFGGFEESGMILNDELHRSIDVGGLSVYLEGYIDVILIACKAHGLTHIHCRRDRWRRWRSRRNSGLVCARSAAVHRRV